MASNAFETPSGNFIALGFTFDTISNLGYFTLLGLDSQGSNIWRKNYGTTKFAYLPNILAAKQAIVCESTFFYTTLAARDSTNSQVGVLIKFNYDGDTIWQKVYKDTAPKDVIPQA